jgi:hypothetical protein
MQLKLTPLYTCLLLSASCQSSLYKIDIDAVSKTDFQAGQTFTLQTSGENKDPLLKGQFEDYIVRGLTKKGFTQSESSVSDIVIHLDYMVSDPYAVEYSYNSPIFGQIGFYTSHSHGHVDSSSGFHSVHTTYKPHYGVTGYVTRTGSYTHYTRSFSIEALAYGSASPEDILWRTTAKSSGSSDDLRKVFPMLVVGCWEVFGEDTGGVRRIDLRAPVDMTKYVEYVDGELGLE